MKKWMRIAIAFAIAIIVTGSLSEARTMQMQQQIAKEVFRFHVLANSDSPQDQALKMKVKENVIAYMREKLPESESVVMTRQWVVAHLEEIEQVAVQTLQKEGCNDAVTAKVTNCYFPDKTYGDITFPKGNYEALRIEIGAARGQNWWCVLYPNLCFIDAVHAVVPDEGKEELKNVLDDEEYKLVTATPKFRVKWFFFRW